MLLADLNTLYSQLLSENRLAPPRFQKRPVRLFVELDSTGRCVGAVDLDRDATQRVVPVLSRASKATATIVTDNGQYVLGIAQRPEERDYTKAERARVAYLQRLQQAIADLEGVPELLAQLTAILEFVTDAETARSVLKSRGVQFVPGPDGSYPHAGALVAFRVDGSDPLDHPALQTWWAATVDTEEGTGTEGVCQLTGAVQPLARLMPAVKGIGGTQPKLISSNFDSALRYNASQSSGAQLGITAATRTHQALNWLLSEPGHHRRMGGLTLAWWVVEDLGVDPFSEPFDPSESIDQLVTSPWQGKRPGAQGEATFRLLGLSVNEARVVVRLDHSAALIDLRRRIERWLTLVAVPARGGATRRVPIGALADSAMGPGSGNARQAQRERITADLVVALITGTRPAERVRNAAVRRCAAERAVPPARAALLKLCQQFPEVNMPDQDPTVGELCGRLLAQVERAQWAALGDTNRTVTDRFYAKASVNPEQAFPHLLRGAQAHLSKVRRQKPGLQHHISRRLGEIAELIGSAGGIPRSLSMSDQADFALGYWQERQELFANGGKSRSRPNSPQQEDEEA